VLGNTLPTQNNPILNSTSGNNATTDNITCYNQSTSDADGDAVTNIYNWYKNSQPLMLLNMPFDSDNSAGAGQTKDYSGRGYTGADGAATWTSSGKVGGAYNFDGNDDYITITNDDAVFNFYGKPYTIEAWIKLSGLSSGSAGYGAIFDRIQPGTGNGYRIDYSTTSNNWRICDLTLATVYPITTGVWYHMVQVRYSNGTGALYLNGTSILSGACNQAANYNVNPRIGNAQDLGADWNGTIDEVRVYNFTLSENQIKQRYADTKDGYSNSETITSSGLTVNDVWMCQVTPNDGMGDGTTKNSTNLTILSLADLLPVNITYSPYGPITGTSVTINATIKNQGLTNAGSFNVSLYVDDVYQSQNNIASLNAGVSTTTTFTWTATTALRDIKVFADSAGQIAESSETNNNLTKTIGVDWPMFHQTPEHLGYSSATNLSTTANKIWSFNTSGGIGSSPAIANGILYIGTGYVSPDFYALNATTGTQIWNYTADSAVTSSPAVYRGIVYFDSDVHMYALNATTGVYIWNSTDYYLTGTPSPAVYDGRVYVTSQSDVNIFALNATTGAKIWNYSIGGPITSSSPAVSNGVVYVGSDPGLLYALDAVTGTLIWSKTIATTACGGVRSSPAVVNNIVYITPCNSSILALYANNGSTFWNTVVSGTFAGSSPAVANDRVYVGSWVGNLFAMNATTGVQLWNYSTGNSIGSSPAVAGGIVYFGGYTKDLYALNATNGSKIWNYTTGSSVTSSPAIGPDGTIYVGSNDKLVYAIGTLTGNQAPTHDNPKLNATSANNLTSDNITCYNQTTSDPNGDNVTNVYNWYKNSQPLMLLNLPFDSDDSGGVNTTKDYSGKNNNGQLGNATNGDAAEPTWTSAGRVGGAYAFDGSNDYVSLGKPNSLNFTGYSDFTISAWVNVQGSQGTHRPIVCKGDTQYCLKAYTDDKFEFCVYDVTWVCIYSNNTLSLGTWYNVVARASGSGLAMWVNGIQQTQTNVHSGITADGNDVQIGADTGANRYFNGTVDEVRIYNYSVSAAQIQRIYLDAKDGYSSSETIVSSELAADDLWMCQVTPSDALIDGTTKNSTTLTIRSAPRIFFVPPTPDNGTITENTSVEIRINITDSNMTEFKWNWNGTNYTFYNDSLVLMYNFDNVSAIGDTGTKAVDVSKFSNDGTCTNMGTSCLYTTGKYGKAMVFNGTSGAGNYVSAGSSSSINPAALTYSAWVKADNFTNSYNAVIAKSEAGGRVATLMVKSNGKLACYVTATGGSVNYDGTGTYTLQSGQWYYVAMTYDSVNGLKGYVNGSLDNSAAANGAITTGSDVVWVGSHPSITPRYWNGTIDEVRIYNRALVSGEITQSYNSNLNKYDAGKWQFYTNQSNLSVGTYTYYGAAKNGLGFTNSTETRYLIITADTAPTVNLISPASGTVTNQSTQTFRCNITDDRQVANLTLYVWNSTGNNIHTNTSTLSGTSATANFTYTLPYENTFSWNCLGYDNASKSDWADSNFTIQLNNVPQIFFVPPTPDNNTNTSNTSVEIKINVTESDLDTFIWNWNGTNYTPYNDSLVLMFGFNNIAALGESVAVAKDVSNYNNHGAIVAATYTSGRYGNSLSFNGANANVAVNPAASLMISNQITMEAWVNLTDYSVRPVISRRNAVTDGYSLLINNTIVYCYLGNGAVSYDFVKGNTSLAFNRWYHIVCTWKGIGNNLELYLDGKLDGQSASAIASIGSLPIPFLYTGYDTPTNTYYSGRIDEPRVYDRGMNAAEAKQQYLSNLAKYDIDKWQFYTNQTNLTTGTYTYYGCAKDGANQANCTGTRLLTHVPSVSNVTVTSTRNFTLDDLNCTGIYSDGTEVNSTFKWFESSDSSSWSTLSPTTRLLDSDYTKEYYYYMCEYTPSDGTYNGIAANSSSLRILPLNASATYSSGPYNENGNVSVDSAGRLTLGSFLNVSGTNFVTVLSNGNLTAKENITTHGLEIQNYANFTIDAVSAGKNLYLKFLDQAGCGITSSSWGWFRSIGNATNQVTVTSTASGNPTNRWIATWDVTNMELTADYTTFEKYGRLYVGESDIDNCVFTNAYNHPSGSMLWGTVVSPISFTNNVLTAASYGIYMPVFSDKFDNITISNTDNYAVGANGVRLEFNRSNFALDKVYLYTVSSHVISRNHISNNNYLIWAGVNGLSKSALTYDFTVADNVTVYQGLFTIDNAANADNLTIRNGAVATTAANIITVTNNVVLSGNLTGGSADHSFGTLTVNSGGKYDATSGKTAITSSANSVTTYSNSGSVNANSGTFIFQNGGSTQSAYLGTELYNVIINKTTGIYQQTLNPTINNDLTVKQGFFTWGGGLQSGVLTVTGAVNISGFLGTSGYTTMHTGSYTFGSLTVNSGGTYDATSGNTVITSVNSNSRTVDNAGTITHNNGIINITTSSGNPPFILNGQHVYNLELSGATGHKWYGGNGATVTYVDGNMTVDAGASAQGFYNADALTVTGSALVSGTLSANSMNANISLGSLTINSGGAYYATNGTTLLNGAALVGSGGKYTAGAASTFKISTASTGLRVQNTGNISIIGTSGNYATMTRRDADSGNWQLTVESGAITNFTYVNMSYVNATWNASSTISYSTITNAGTWTVYTNVVLKLVNSIFRQIAGAIFHVLGTLVIQGSDAIFGHLNVTGNMTMVPGANVTVQNNFYCSNATTLINDTAVYGNLIADNGCGLTISGGKSFTVSGSATINTGATVNGGTGSIYFGSLAISGGTYNATTGNTTLGDDFVINSGTFNHNSGTVVGTCAGGTYGDCFLGGQAGSNAFYNVIVQSGRMAANYGIDVQGNLTIASGASFYEGSAFSSQIGIFGTNTASSYIKNSGDFGAYSNTGGRIMTLTPKNSAYPIIATNNDWNWDYAGAGSIINVSYADLQFDATTGGAGVTVIFGGNMTVDGFAVSSGDTLNITTPGVVITGNNAKEISNSGTLNILGIQANYVQIGTTTAPERLRLAAGNAYLQYVNLVGRNYGLHFGGGAASLADNLNISTQTSAGGVGAAIPITDSTVRKVTNSKLYGQDTAWTSADISIYTNGKLECENCTFNYVGLQASSGWLISKNHNNVTNDWRYYGILNTDAADLGFRASNWNSNVNVTLLNADAYSTAFNTNIVVNEVATANLMNVNVSAIMNLTGGSLTTISNSYLNNSGKIFVVSGTWTNLTLADSYSTKQTIVGKNVQVANVLSTPTLNYGDNAIGKYSNISSAGTSPNAFINISYAHGDLGTANESQLELWKNNGSWYKVETTGVDTNQNYVWGNASTFSIFVPLDANYAPNVTQVNLTAKNNFTLDDLYCNASITDADGNAPWPIFNWYRNSAPDAALYLPFDTNATNANGAVKDYSGNNNNGTWSGGTTWTSNGELGGAYAFRGDGSGDTIAIPHNSLLEPASITVEFWAKLNSDGTRHVMVTKWTGYTTEVNSDGTFKWGLNGLPSQYFGTKTISFGQWHQLVGTFDNTTKLQCTYIDGNLSECQTASGTISYGGATLYVSWGSETNGTIDEVKIYNHALSAHQINKDYLMGLNKLNNSIIDSDETNEGDTWMCQVTPNDGIADGTTVNSSTRQIAPLTVSDTYTGAFTEAGNMTVAGTGNLSLSSSNIIVAGPVKVNGTFIGGTGNHSFGSVTINSGGNYSATSALTTVKGSWNSTGGTFRNNSGTVRFTGLSANAILDGSSQFNRVEFNDSSAFSITAYKFDATNMLLTNGTLYTRAVNDCDIGSSQMNYTQTGGTLFDPIGSYVCMLNVYLSGGTLDPNWLSYWGNFTITGGDTGTGGAWQARGTNNALQYFNTTLPINAYFYVNGNNTLKLLSNVTLVGSNIFLQYSNSNVFDLNGYAIATPSGYVMVDQYYGGGNKQQLLTPNGSAIIVPLLAIGYGNSGVGTSIVGTPNANWTLKVNNVTVDGLSGGTLYLPNANGFVNVTDTVTVRNANGVLNGSANGNYYFGTLNISSGGLYVATTGLTQINGPAYVAGNYSAGVSTTKISTASTGLRIQNGGNISIIGTSGNYATMTRRDADSGNWQLTVESGAITNFTYVNMSYVNATWNASSTISNSIITNAGDWTIYAGSILKLVNSIFTQLPGAIFKIFGTLILDATNAVFGNLNLTQTGNMTMLPGANVTVQNSFYCYNQTTLTNDTTVYGNLVAYSGCNITISGSKTLTVNGTTTINSGAVIGSNSAYGLDLTSITINSGGTLNAPNAAGTFNLSRDLINYGTFNPDSGTVITDSKSTDTDQYIEGNIKFFNLIVNSYWTTNLGTTAGAQTIIVENNLNVTSAKTVSINSGNGPVTVILGNSSQAGLLYNGGVTNLNGNTASASILRGNSSAYLGVVSGNDLNWDGGGSGSKVNVSFLDYRIDATTGGAGVTINFNGDMTIDSFAISAGDTLNATPGITVTGDATKAIPVYGTLNSDGAKWNGYRWMGFYANSAGSIKNSNITSAGQGDNAIIFGYTSGTVNVVFDNNTVSGNGFGAIRVGAPTNTIKISNCTLADGDHSAYYKYSVCVDNNAKLESGNSIVPTVALTGGTGGWFVSKDHNKVSGDWRIWGIVSSSAPDSGYKGSDWTTSTNVTLLNADAYSTAFNTTFTQDENVTLLKLNLTASTTYKADAVSAGKPLYMKFADTAGAGFVRLNPASSSFTAIGNSTNRVFVTTNAAGAPTNYWGFENAGMMKIDALYANFTYYANGLFYDVNMTNVRLSDTRGGGGEYGAWLSAPVRAFNNIDMANHPNGALGTSDQITGLNNVVISSGFIYPYLNNARLEFNNSNFAVSVLSGGFSNCGIISRNHNDVSGDYWIWGSSDLKKSSITDDFKSGDKVTTYQGTLLVDENANLYILDVSRDSAVNVSAGLNVTFDDTAGAGIAAPSSPYSGTLTLNGNSTNRVFLTSANKPPTNYWGVSNFGGGTTINTKANYATIEYNGNYGLWSQSTGYFNNVVFRNFTNYGLYIYNVGGSPMNNTEFYKSGSAYALYVSGLTNYLNNITIYDQGTGMDYYDGCCGGRQEFTNSSFNAAKVQLVSGGNVISDNHNRIANDYYIWASTLSKTQVTNDFASGDFVTVRSGTYTIDENAALKKMNVTLGTIINITAGNTITFDDAVGAGFGNSAETTLGTFNFNGNSGNRITVTSASAPNPTNRWTFWANYFGSGGILNAQYTNFISYDTIIPAASGVTINNCNFLNASNRLELIWAPTQFKNNYFSTNYGSSGTAIIVYSGIFNFENATIVGDYANHIGWDCCGGDYRIEAVNSTFDVNKIIGGGGSLHSVVSKNHNNVLNDYYIWTNGYALNKSQQIYYDFSSADNVTVYAGAFNADEAANADYLTIRNVAAMNAITGNSISITKDAYVYGNLTGGNANHSFGSLTINSSGICNATSGFTNVTNGNLINWGTFLPNSGTVEMANHSYFIGFASSFNKLKIDNGKNVSHMAEGFIANSDVTVNGLLDSKQNALSFDGVNDYVQSNSAVNLLGSSNDVTFEVWVKPSSTQVQYADIFDNNHGAVTNFVIQQDSSNANLFYFGFWDGTGWSGTAKTTQLTANVWQHFVVVKSGTNMDHYLNGVKQGATITVSADINTTTQLFRIGEWVAGSGDRVFNGTIDEVRIYNRSLSASEVKEQYRNIYSNETGLVGKWRFSEGYGTATADESGSNNNCTINSATWVLPNVTMGSLTIGSGGTYSATSGTSLINGAALVQGGGLYTAGPGSTFKISTADTGLKIQDTGNISVIGAANNYAVMTRRDADSGNWQLTVEKGANTNFTYVNMSYVAATWNASSTLTSVQVWNAGDWTVYQNAIVKFVNSIFRQLINNTFKIWGTLILDATDAIFGNVNITETGNMTMLPGANVTALANFRCANTTTLTNTTAIGGNLTVDTGCILTIANGYSLNVDGDVVINSGATLKGGNSNHRFRSLTINSGGAYNATSGITTITGGTGKYYTQGSAMYAPGTLNHNNGTFIFTDSHITIDSASSFYNLNLSTGGYIYLGTNIVADNNFVFTGGELISEANQYNNLTINGNATVSSALGPIIVDNDAYHFGVVKVIGTTTVTSSGSINGRFGTPKILNLTGIVSNSGNINVRNNYAYVYGEYSGTGNVTLTTGTFNTTNKVTVTAGGRFGNSTGSGWTGNFLRGLNIQGTFYAPNSNGYLAVKNPNAYDAGLTVNGNGYVHNNGTIVVGFDGDNRISPGTSTFYNAIMDGTATNYIYTDNWQIEQNLTINSGKNLMTGSSATVTLGTNTNIGRAVNNGNYNCGSARTNIYAANAAYPYLWTGNAPTVNGAWSDVGTNLHLKWGDIQASIVVAGNNRSVITEGNMTFNGITVNAPTNSSYYDIFNVTSGTTKSGGAVSINGTFDAALGSLDINNTLTLNSNGVLNAPNASNVFTFDGGNTGSGGATWDGVFNHDSGTLVVDGNAWLVKAGTVMPTFYNVNMSYDGAALLNGGMNATVENAFTIASGKTAWVFWAAGAASGRLTLGTNSNAGSIISSGTLQPVSTSGIIYIQPKSSSYPFVATGTDWNWDAAASSQINLRYGDIQFDATTGGGGVTVVFENNMTLDGFTTSSGDKINITVPGITITGDGNKNFVFGGAANILGNSTNYVNILGFGSFYFPSVQASTLNYVRTNASNIASSTPFWANGAAPTVSNCIFEKSSSGYGATFSNSNGLYKFTNVTITGPSGVNYYGKHVWLYGEAGGYVNKLECDNCTFSTVGMQYRGWLVSKTHNSVLNDWKIWGAVNSSEPDDGFEGNDWTNITNVTLLNADAYSGAFNTTFTQDENVIALKLNITTNTNHNMLAGTVLTFPDSVAAGFASDGRGTLNAIGTSNNWVTIKSSAAGVPTNSWNIYTDMNLNMSYVDARYWAYLDAYSWDCPYGCPKWWFNNVNITTSGVRCVDTQKGVNMIKFDNVNMNVSSTDIALLWLPTHGSTMPALVDNLQLSLTSVTCGPYPAWGGKMELNNSNYDVTKVCTNTDAGGGDVVSLNTNDVANDYYVFTKPAGLNKSVITNDFTSADNVTVYQGMLVINEAASANKFTIRTGTNVSVAAGSTVTAASITQLNGSLYINSGTWTNLTLNDIASTTQTLQASNVQVFNVLSKPTDPSDSLNVSRYVNLTNISTSASAFTNISYSDSDINSEYDESQLEIWKNNGSWIENGWNGTRVVDTTNNIVGVNITNFGSIFAPLGPITPPQIFFVSPPTPANGTITGNTSVAIQINITEPNLLEFIWNWNGTNYTFYNNSLVLMYNLDNVASIGDSAVRATDVSSYLNHGTIFQAAYVPGKYRNGLDFDGINDNVNAASLASLSITGAITIEAWVKVTGTTTDPIVDKRQVPAGTDGYALWLDTNRAQFFLGDNAVNVVATGSTAMSSGSWHHIVGTWDGPGNNLKVYLDGVYDGQSAGTKNNAIATNPGLLYLAHDTPTNNWYADFIDEVRIYNRGMSASEVKQQYLSNFNKYGPSNWTFYTNETNLSAGVYTYYGCAKDTFAHSNCTGIRYLTIGDAPNAPTLLYPANGGTITNTTPTLNFTTTDINNDTLHYIVELYNNSGLTQLLYFGNSSAGTTGFVPTPPVASGLNVSYTNGTALAVDHTYWWRAKAFDGILYSGWSSTFNFTLISFISCELSQSTIDFITISPGTYDNNATKNYAGAGGSTLFNITSSSNVNATIQSKGTNMTCVAGSCTGYEIFINYTTWNSSKVSNSTISLPGFNLTEAYDTANPIATNITPGSSAWLRYWVDIPDTGQASGTYQGNYTIRCIAS
jgi:hypothetical protein